MSRQSIWGRQRERSEKLSFSVGVEPTETPRRLLAECMRRPTPLSIGPSADVGEDVVVLE